MVNMKALFLGTQVRQVTQAFTSSQEWYLALDPGSWHSHFRLLHQRKTDFKLNSSNFKEALQALQCCHVRFHGARPPANGSVWDPSRSLQHTPAAPSLGCASVLQHSPVQAGDQKTMYHVLFGHYWGLGTSFSFRGSYRPEQNLLLRVVPGSTAPPVCVTIVTRFIAVNPPNWPILYII